MPDVHLEHLRVPTRASRSVKTVERLSAGCVRVVFLWAGALPIVVAHTKFDSHV